MVGRGRHVGRVGGGSGRKGVGSGRHGGRKGVGSGRHGGRIVGGEGGRVRVSRWRASLALGDMVLSSRRCVIVGGAGGGMGAVRGHVVCGCLSSDAGGGRGRVRNDCRNRSRGIQLSHDCRNRSRGMQLSGREPCREHWT